MQNTLPNIADDKPANKTAPEFPVNAGAPTVAVVITTYNHAHYLDEAIQSVLDQSVPAAEIIVVDDGSTDNSSDVVNRYRGVALIRQSNQGLSSARNTGLKAVKSNKVIFLDADDCLEESAIFTGLRCFSAYPDNGFVYGGYRMVTADRTPAGQDIYPQAGTDCHMQLLHINHIGMHATVMFDREKLSSIGGYDATLKRCEDYDVYFRMCKLFKVTAYQDIVADYRMHDTNMSSNPQEMLKWALLVHEKHKPDADSGLAGIWKSGRQCWKNYYAGEELSLSKTLFKAHRFSESALHIGKGALMSPLFCIRRSLFLAARLALRAMPRRVVGLIYRAANKKPPVGAVRLGDLGGTDPINGNFGFGRGTPVDRYYIEKFLGQNSEHIKGRALEVGDAAYCRQFGGEKIAFQDVLNIGDGAPETTLIGDLGAPDPLPSETFDSMVLTQTLHLIFDLKIAASNIYDALKPGGVGLITVPGISPVDRFEWRETWYWSMAPLAMRRLFEPLFGAENVEITAYGNVYSTTLFMQGMVVEEADTKKLDVADEVYPVIVALKVTRRNE